MTNLQIIAETGVGYIGSDTPLMLMSYSDDGGRTFTNDREGSMGDVGQYRKRIKWNRLGRFYQRVIRLRGSSAVRRAIITAEAELEVLSA